MKQDLPDTWVTHAVSMVTVGLQFHYNGALKHSRLYFISVFRSVSPANMREGLMTSLVYIPAQWSQLRPTQDTNGADCPSCIHFENIFICFQRACGCVPKCSKRCSTTENHEGKIDEEDSTLSDVSCPGHRVKQIN